ncbi:UNVERIFIED_CONTAM: hypothetical protein GTU68_013436 [Idotea baltica]|nr:hypothetical protein [Idotea baltica]
MVVHRETGKIEHKVFKDIVNYFEEGDIMVANNTKVFPARLFGRKEKTGAAIEVFLLRELNKENRLWDVLVDPARKKDDQLIAEVEDNTTSRGRTIRFIFEGTEQEFIDKLDALGNTPLPRYIDREIEPEDKERYQTLFAKERGAVAAPTAGLHFSREILTQFQIMGIDMPEITLHVGLGTFKPIEVEDLSKHKMDAEYYTITEKAADRVNRALREKKRICAIGTTSVRSMESSVSAIGELKPSGGWTNMFIYEPYKFRIHNCMITNFHLPKTSLIIMVCAFAGYDLAMKAYQEAIKEKYRFFSYGDAMLII